MVQAILFDIDGTLLDSVDFHAHAWQEILARHGIDVTFAAVRAQIGKGGDQLLPVFVPKPMLERLGEQIKQERSRYFKEKYLPKVRPFPKVPELFQRIRQDGKQIVLASSGKREEVNVNKRIAGIEGLVDADTSSDEADRSKPHPDIFVVALKKLGNPDPATVVAVGDTPYDAEAAGKAGIKTIGVLCGGFPEKSLREAGCIALYCDPADLLAHYEKSWLA
jgi:HAD superfamily hydrolase (TIGR01509 family)